MAQDDPHISFRKKGKSFARSSILTFKLTVRRALKCFRRNTLTRNLCYGVSSRARKLIAYMIIVLLIFLFVSGLVKVIDNLYSSYLDGVPLSITHLTHVVKSPIYKQTDTFYMGSKAEYQHVALHSNKLFASAADLTVITAENANMVTFLPLYLQHKKLDDIVRDHVVMNEHSHYVPPTFTRDFVRAITSTERPKRHLMIYLMTSAIASFTEKCLIEQADTLAPFVQRASYGVIAKNNYSDGHTLVRKFVLATGCNDMPTSYTFFYQENRGRLHLVRDLLSHPLLAHWFGQNGDIIHPRFTPMPIGIDYHTNARTGRKKDLPTAQEQTLVQASMDALNMSEVLPPHVRVAQVRVAGLAEEELRAGLPATTTTTLQWTTMSELASSLAALPRRSGDGAAADQTVWVDVGVIREQLSFDAPMVHRDGFGTADMLTRVAVVTRSDTTASRELSDASRLQRPTLYLTVPTVLNLYLKANPFGHPKKRQLRVIYAFNANGYEHRRFVETFLLSHMHDIAVNGRGSRSRTWRMLREYAFVASPPGNGYDCHRVWEALAMGCIPILQYPEHFTNVLHMFSFFSDNIHEIQANSSLELYADLPVIFVHDYAKELTQDNLRRWRDEVYHNFTQGKYKLEKLFNEYWVKRMLSV